MIGVIIGGGVALGIGFVVSALCMVALVPKARRAGRTQAHNILSVARVSLPWAAAVMRRRSQSNSSAPHHHHDNLGALYGRVPRLAHQPCRTPRAVLMRRPLVSCLCGDGKRLQQASLIPGRMAHQVQDAGVVHAQAVVALPMARACVVGRLVPNFVDQSRLSPICLLLLHERCRPCARHGFAHGRSFVPSAYQREPLRAAATHTFVYIRPCGERSAGLAINVAPRHCVALPTKTRGLATCER